MNPKEKATELIDKFASETAKFSEHGSGESDFELGKGGALICVDELIKYLPSSAGNPPNLQEYESNKEWWEKVKKEIDQC